MKLLFDENLSAKLATRLLDIFPGSSHITTVGLEGSADLVIWNYAQKNDFVIVSKDNDFRQRAFRYGTPPKVIWLSIGNAGTTSILALIKQNFQLIEDFEKQTEEALLVIAS